MRRWLPHAPQRRWAKITLGVLTVVVVALGTPVSWSLGRALSMPGGGTLPERIAEWARDHYLGPVVTLGEYLIYTPPKVGGKPSFKLSAPSAAAVQNKIRAKNAALARQYARLYAPPAPLKTFATKPLPGEGVWRVLASVNGHPAIFGTYLRASSVYTSYVAGIASINPNLVKFQLRPGMEDPGPANWKTPAWVPPGTRNGLLATFNGGFKIANSDGGFYLNGTTKGTLTPGVASEVYYRNGQIAIGVWDRTVRMTSNVVGVRQNLHLIVQNGKIPSAVNYNVETSWGATLGGSYYVWRSGIGVTKTGRIIYAYGPELDVREIAELLQRAGAVTAMQLDINPDWMSFEYYLPGNNPANPKPVNLLPNQMQPANRYYSLANRDFTVVYGR